MPWGDSHTSQQNEIVLVYPNCFRFSTSLAIFEYTRVLWRHVLKSSVRFSHSAHPTLWNLMDCSTPGFPVFHQLLELAQTHVHQVGDALKSYLKTKRGYLGTCTGEEMNSLRDPRGDLLPDSVGPLGNTSVDFLGFSQYRIVWEGEALQVIIA